jgi:hypothetical protein
LYYTSLLAARERRLRWIHARPKFVTITHIVLLPQFLQRAKGCCCGSGALLELMHDEQHGDSAYRNASRSSSSNFRSVRRVAAAKRRRAPGGCARLKNSFASAKRLHNLILAGPKKARNRPQMWLRSQVSRSIHRALQGLFRSSAFLALPGFLAGAAATFTLMTYRWRRETFGDVTL